MSLHSNWVTLTTVPWKTFIKASDKTVNKSEKTFSACLDFKGTEAKSAYEDIISQNFKSDTPTKAETKVESSNKFKCNNSESVKKNVKNISTNSILKAVEQNDLCFLKEHLNSDNVNVSDDFGWTPLMSAAYKGNMEIVEYLLKLGVNKKAKEKSGLTAAQLALKKNHLNVVALLKRKNIQRDNVNIMDEIILSRNKIDNAPCEDEQAIMLKSETIRKNRANNTQNNSSNINSEFFCKICEANFKETTIKQHETSTVHIFNTKPKLRSVGYGIAKQNKGYQMLLNTGWDEETGLGPSGKGTKYPIKTILKRDRKGLGQADEKEARVTHFKPGDISAVTPTRVMRQKTLKKKDREKLLSREAMKDRMLRIALS